MKDVDPRIATSVPTELQAPDRLIVALDVPTADEALRAVETLDNVTFFKIGLQLFITGDLARLLQQLRGKHIFVDLKIPGDIGNTIAAVIDFCVKMNVQLLTLSESMPLPAISAATRARDRHQSAIPKLLTVPFLSSLDASDLPLVAGGSHGAADVETYILKRAHAALGAGCDGLIASGDAIAICRRAFPAPTLIVSPGIRPAGTATDDHKRFTTPADAMRLGADYLVVGRPILQAPDPRAAAARIIEEIDQAVKT